MIAIANVAHYNGQFNVYAMTDGTFRVGAAHDTAEILAAQIGGKFRDLDRAIGACKAAAAALAAHKAGALEFSNEHADI